MEINFPSHVTAIITEAAAKYTEDIDKATSVAERKIRALDDFDSIVGLLVTSAVKEKINDARHTSNVRLKTENREYGGKAKVIVGNSAAVNGVAESCYYNHFIAGKTLGMVMGEELAVIATSEAEKGRGHFFNSRLAAKLAAVVPEGKCVKDAVSNKKLEVIWKEAMGGECSSEAEALCATHPNSMPLSENRHATESRTAKRPKQRVAARSTGRNGAAKMSAAK